MAAGTRIGCEHELEAGRIAHRRTAARDRDDARFQGRSQGFQHRGPELGCLIEEEHAPMGQGDGPGSGDASPSPDHGSDGGGVMRIGERWPADQPVVQIMTGQ